MKDSKLPGGSRLIRLPNVADRRGILAYATSGIEIPFPVVRVFWIYDVPINQSRGGHAHRVCSEVVFAVKGSFTMCVDDGHGRSEVRIDDPTLGILVPANVWCELRDFEPDTVLAVLASHPYDSQGYVDSYEEFLKEKRL